jgi:hypothetical protein
MCFETCEQGQSDEWRALIRLCTQRTTSHVSDRSELNAHRSLASWRPCLGKLVSLYIVHAATQSDAA